MRVVVRVVRASNLMPKDGHGSASPFVEVDLNGQKLRTRTRSTDLDPQWDEPLEFNVSDDDDLTNLFFKATVFHECHPDNRFLGRVRVRLSDSPIAPSYSDSTEQFYPLKKKWIFSSTNIRGELYLRVYTLSDRPKTRKAIRVMSMNPALDSEF